MNEIVLAFDFGTKSIGVAVGQNITKTARPLKTLKVYNRFPNWSLVENLFKEWHPNKVIIGLPLNMDGTEQDFTFKVYKFSRKIYKLFSITVILHDERLSTMEAKSRLFEYGGFHLLNKNKIDSVSAVVIIESYFNQQIIK